MSETAVQQGFQILPLAKLIISPNNPRKHIDKARIAELADSIRTHGVLTPLLVCPNGEADKFEILAGERRYRAAKAAGRTEVPTVVKTGLSDREKLEIMIIENLQREDVHPLEEADGYKSLLAQTKPDGSPEYDVQSLADRCGKSVSYVYQRLKLGELSKAGKKYFYEGTIDASHAVLLARLTPEIQDEIIEKFLIRRFGKQLETRSVRDLADHIAREYHLDLSKAVFDTKNATLYAAAGSCVTCPKRTGATPMLFPEIKKKDTCTDRACFSTKLQLHLKVRAAELKEKGEEPVLISKRYGEKLPEGVLGSADYQQIFDKKKTCDATRIGLVVSGWNGDVGTELLVCLDKKCKTHHPGFSSGGSTGNGKSVRALMKQNAFEKEARLRTLTAALPKLKKFSDQAWRIMLAGYAKTRDSEVELLYKRREWTCTKKKWGTMLDFHGDLMQRADKLSGDDCQRIMLELSLLDECRFYSMSQKQEPAERLMKFAKLVGVKPVSAKELEKQAAAEKLLKKKAKKTASTVGALTGKLIAKHKSALEKAAKKVKSKHKLAA